MSTDFEKKYKGWHQTLSFLKSGIRIAACLGSTFIALALDHAIGIMPALLILTIGLAFAEVIGIAEEWF